jgi:hypothetical protein
MTYSFGHLVWIFFLVYPHDLFYQNPFWWWATLRKKAAQHWNICSVSVGLCFVVASLQSFEGICTALLFATAAFFDSVNVKHSISN